MADIPEPIRDNLIIGLSVGVGSAVLTCVIVLIILFCRSKHKEKQAQKHAQAKRPHLNSAPPISECSLNPQGPTSEETEPKRFEDLNSRSLNNFVASGVEDTSNPVGEDQVYPSTSYVQRPAPSDVEHLTSGGVKTVRLPEDYRATCPPLTMAPFRSQSLAGLPGSNRPSTIAGLPTFSHTNLTWGRQRDENRDTIKRRASDVSSLRAKQMMDSDGQYMEHHRKPIQNSTVFTKGLYRNQFNPEHLLAGPSLAADTASYTSDLPEDLCSDMADVLTDSNIPYIEEGQEDDLGSERSHQDLNSTHDKLDFDSSPTHVHFGSTYSKPDVNSTHVQMDTDTYDKYF